MLISLLRLKACSSANSRYKGIFSLADIREIAFAYPSSCIFAVLPMF